MNTTDIQPILDRVLDGGRMTAEECATLLQSYDIACMGAAADEVRKRKHPEGVVTYIIDRNIIYTNVCNVVCTFCAFYRRPGAPDSRMPAAVAPNRNPCGQMTLVPGSPVVAATLTSPSFSNDAKPLRGRNHRGW